MEKNDERGKSFGDLMMSIFYIVLLCTISYGVYFIANEKYSMQKTVKALNLFTKNMQATFDSEGTYPSAGVIRTYPITPTNMEVKDAQEYYWRHYFGGSMLISGVVGGDRNTGKAEYNIIFNTISKRDCKIMTTYDWRSFPSFLGLTSQGYSILAKSASRQVPNIGRLFTAAEAEKMCSCENGKYCSVILVFK